VVVSVIMKKQCGILFLLVFVFLAAPGLLRAEGEVGDTFFKKGNEYYKQQKFEEAIKFYGKTVDINPEHLGAFYNLALCYQETGQFKKAEETFRKAMDLDTTYMPAKIGLGIVYTRQSRYDDAIQVYKDAIRSDSDYYIAHLNLAAVYAKKGLYQEAIAEAKTALNIDPREMNGHLLLGNIYSVIKDNDNAINEYEWILKIDPKFFQARLHIGMAYANKGDFAKAVENITAVKGLTKNYGYVHYYLGKVFMLQYEKTRDEAFLDNAIREFKEAVRISERLVDVFIDLGKAYDLKRDTKMALRSYRRYIDSPYANEEQKQVVTGIVKSLRERLANENISPKLPVNPNIKDAQKK